MPEMDVALKDAMQIGGALGAALVDAGSGMALGLVGGTADFDMAVAAACTTDVVRAKLRTMQMLGLDDSIEDILTTMDGQYHLIRPLTSRTGQGLFLYLALEKVNANLAMARFQLRRIESTMDL
jgi:hypothetical protein